MHHSLHRRPLAAHIYRRYAYACSPDRIDAENSPVDVLQHRRRQRLSRETNSHIINLPPSSTYAVDTLFIPHLPLSSCYLRWRCGIEGGGGRLLLCVWEKVCCFVSGNRASWQLEVAKPGFRGSPLRSPNPITSDPLKIKQQTFGEPIKGMKSPSGLPEQHSLIGHGC